VISKAYIQVQQQVVAQVKNFTAIHKNSRIAPSLKCMLSGLFKAGFQFLFEVFIHCIILLQLFAPWCLTCLPFKDSSYNFGEKKLKHLAQLSATLSIHVMSHL
jgi:hypothetical protein